MNLVVLVLDSFTQNSIRNSKIQKSTWVKDVSNYCEVLFYKGGLETIRSGHDLLLNCSDSYSDMGIKSLKAFEWVDSNLSYDYIFRTNTSSYVNYKNLINYLKKIQEEGIDYCGYIGDYDGIEYVSGSGIILSEHAIKSIIRYKSELDTEIVEDVAFGKLLKLNEISPIKGKRKDIESHKDIRNIDSDEYHIRCRLDSFGYSRNLEKYLLNFIFLSFNRKRFFLELIISYLMKLNKFYLKTRRSVKLIISNYL
tara:strand:- start:151 stop:909 length:759 start_codon:yes stop_codon:yes gene_type:complete